jgi:hypothetical protein
MLVSRCLNELHDSVVDKIKTAANYEEDKNMRRKEDKEKRRRRKRRRQNKTKKNKKSSLTRLAGGTRKSLISLHALGTFGAVKTSQSIGTWCANVSCNITTESAHWLFYHVLLSLSLIPLFHSRTITSLFSLFPLWKSFLIIHISHILFLFLKSQSYFLFVFLNHLYHFSLSLSLYRSLSHT